jgi:hypothetical protein
MRKQIIKAIILMTMLPKLSTNTANIIELEQGKVEIEINNTNKNIKIPYEHTVDNTIGKQENKPKKKRIKKKKYVGWTSSNLNVREHPNTDSNILHTFKFNTKISYYKYNKEWAQTKYNNKKAYVSTKYISKTKCNFNIYDIPQTSGFKSYMPYTSITNKSSQQYKLQSQYAYTGNYGIRQVNGRYCVAIGTAFNSNIGDYADLILSNGEIIETIVSDIKDNRDTKQNNIVTTSNGCVSEFIVDINTLNTNAKRSGDISSCKKEWDSAVIKIKVYNKNIFN